MTSHVPAQPKTVRDAMHDDHVTLERAMCNLLDRACEDDYDELRVAFDRLESELEEHLSVEERDMLPRFQVSFPSEAERIRGEHAEIRRGLDEIGTALDLRALRAHVVADFVAMLRSHAEREEQALYRWADIALPEHEKWPLLHWLAARLEERLSRAA